MVRFLWFLARRSAGAALRGIPASQLLVLEVDIAMPAPPDTSESAALAVILPA